MPSLHIRDMPEEVYEALSLRAKAEHRSLAQQAIVELRRIPELVAREGRLQALETIRKKLEASPPPRLSADPADLIREDRDRERCESTGDGGPAERIGQHLLKS